MIDKMGPERPNLAWRRQRCSGRKHAGQGGNFRNQNSEFLTFLPPVALRISPRNGSLDNKYPLRPEAKGHTVQGDEALDQQASPGKKQHCQRDLSDHEQTTYSNQATTKH